ncbi:MULTISPECIES: hypothetical protein [Pseudomonas]|uniref:hypothetical protein n=1 Tax=Pseudomonas TaxID=286 RepID=UPI001CEFC67F|nr:hypothetical protein [Pseudomonas sp. HS-18]UCL88718.1 hypothetical protein LDJ84_08485 [Pseudomonas sp. HS-18]
MLTNQQITALVLGILLPMILLCITAHTCGLRKGLKQAKLVEFDRGYQAGLAKQSQHLLALQGDIGTLNTRLTNMSAALTYSKEGHELTRQQLADALDYCGAIQGAAEKMQPRVLTDADLPYLHQAIGLIAAEATRFRKTGSSKVNRAHVLEQQLAAIHARASAADWRHPDTELIDWLDVAAAVHADEEHGELRFPLAPNYVGYPHIRDMLHDAKQQDQETARNHQVSLEAAA